MADGRPQDAWELFDRAVELPPAERGTFLDEACRGDRALRARVEHLLAGDARAGTEDGPDFLQSPLVRPTEATSITPPLPLSFGAPLPARIGRYRILRLLGEGGMATVYEAEQDNPRRTVALKMIRSGLMSPSIANRFQHEAQILGRLHHPGIAQIFEAGLAEDGQPYFALEFIRGVPLDEYARLRSLTLPARLELVARVCDAVQHAHEQGVVHRDLKPANILVEETGQPKVLDFGIARVTDADLGTTGGRTQTGQLLGTLRYMSPEQLTADPGAVDARSDVYALGVILFELLAGRLPYGLDGLPLPEAGRVIRDWEPSRLGSIDTCLRGDVETIVARALEKEKQRRYASAAALAADIRRHLSHQPILARSPSALYQLGKFAQRHKALVGGAAGVAAALVLGLVGTLLFAMRAERNARLANLEKNAALAQAYRARLAAAGAALEAYDVAEAARQLDEAPAGLRGWEWRHLHSGLDDSRSALAVPVPGDAFPLVGPRGLAVGMITTKGIFLMDENGGAHGKPYQPAPQQVAAAAPTTRGLWVANNVGDRGVQVLDPAGKVRLKRGRRPNRVVSALAAHEATGRLAVAWHGADRPHTVELFDPSSGKRTGVCTGHRDYIHSLAFSRDGARVVSACEDATARLWDAVTGAPLAVLRGHRVKVYYAAFRPDGARVVTASADGLVLQWDARTGRQVASPYERHRGEVYAAAYSPDGQLVASAGTDRAVRVWRATGRQDVAVLRGHRGLVRRLCFSPDGRRLASVSEDHTARFWEVDAWVGLPVVRGHRSYIYPVAYSPDGRWIASGSWDHTIRLWDARTGHTCAVLRHPSRVLCLAFGPDGSWLVSGCGDDDRLRIWDVTTGRRQKVLRGPGGTIDWVAVSPDGKTVAAIGPGRNASLVETATGRTVPFGKKTRLAFSPDGRWLAGAAESPPGIFLWDARTRRKAAELPGHEAGVQSVVFSPDGRRLLSVGPDQGIRLWELDTGSSQELRGHTGQVYAAAFHPDGTRVAAAGREGIIWLWDTAGGEVVARLQGHTNYVWSLAFSPDGKTLVSGSGDATLRFWDTEPLAARYRARRAAEGLRPEAVRLVERLFREKKDAEKVIAALRADQSLDEPRRHAAICAVLRRQTMAGENGPTVEPGRR
jgi:WD40 repeat protein